MIKCSIVATIRFWLYPDLKDSSSDTMHMRVLINEKEFAETDKEEAEISQFSLELANLGRVNVRSQRVQRGSNERLLATSYQPRNTIL